MKNRSITGGNLRDRLLRKSGKMLRGAALIAILTGATVACQPSYERTVYDNVKTTLVEYEPGKYKIENEEQVSDSSYVVIKTYGGTVKTLGVEQALKIVENGTVEEDYQQANATGEVPDSYYNNHSIDYLLYWSVFGYHMNRPYMYGAYPGYYSSPAVYSRVQTRVERPVTSSRRTVNTTSKSGPIKSGTSVSSRPSSSSRSSYGGSRSSSGGG